MFCTYRSVDTVVSEANDSLAGCESNGYGTDRLERASTTRGGDFEWHKLRL